MNRLKKLMQRIIFKIFKKRRQARCPNQEEPPQTSPEQVDLPFHIKPGGIWSDEVASCVRGGKRYREDERSGKR